MNISVQQQMIQISPITSRVTQTANSAQQLHREFVRLGGMRFKLKNKMLAMLPEIFTSGIWKKYAGTIEEYAGKFGDIAGTTVEKRLRLEENLSDKPFLKAAIATIGVHKVAMVAKITTPEMDEAMAEKLCNMSKMAVQSLSKELRNGQRADMVGEGRNGSQLSFVDERNSWIVGERDCKADALMKKIELDENSTFLFMKLKKKLGKTLSDKEFLKQILEEREKQEFPMPTGRQAQKKGERAGSITDDGGNAKAVHDTTDQKSFTGETFEISQGDGQAAKSLTGDTFEIQTATLEEPRYVKAKRRHQALAPTNGKCAYPNCNSPYTVLHHRDRYSESKNHDSIIPLCKVHHEFMHNNLIQNEKFSANQWKLEVGEMVDVKVSRADDLYRKYRRAAVN